MIKNILNLGDAAIYYDFGDQINIETNRKAVSYTHLTLPTTPVV